MVRGKDMDDTTDPDVAAPALDADAYRLAFAHASHGMAVCTFDGTLLEVNHRLAAMVDETVPDLLVRETLAGLAHPDDAETGRDLLEAVRTGQIPQCTFETRLRHRDGTAVAVRCTCVGVFDGDAPRFLVVHVDDAAPSAGEDPAFRQEQLEHQTRHDPLTGLANRVALKQELDRRLERAIHAEAALPVLYLDIDRFKLVNDTLGHATGDELLRKVADRLRQATRPTDLVARVSGDEFVIVLDSVTSPDNARMIAQRVIDVFEMPFKLGTHQVYASTSVGLAFGGPERPDPSQILVDADVAMYTAKEGGRNRYAEFDETMRARVTARHETDTALRAALEHEQLELHYQPVLRVADRSIIGVEALLRWRRPDHGFVSPDMFVPVAEENGLIVPIGQWVVDEACRQIAEWRQQGIRLRTAINVSARQLQAGGLPTAVATALARYHVSPELLSVEITESVLVHDLDAAIAEIETIRSLGVSIALDDFGTRYSSITYLCRLPIDTIKVDRALTAHVFEDPKSRAVVRMTAGIARELGWQVVAEGIESEAQLEAVAGLGCEFVQGWLISGAVQGADLPALGERWPISGAAPAVPPSTVPSMSRAG